MCQIDVGGSKLAGNCNRPFGTSLPLEKSMNVPQWTPARNAIFFLMLFHTSCTCENLNDPAVSVTSTFNFPLILLLTSFNSRYTYLSRSLQGHSTSWMMLQWHTLNLFSYNPALSLHGNLVPILQEWHVPILSIHLFCSASDINRTTKSSIWVMNKCSLHTADFMHIVQIGADFIACMRR